MEPEPSLYERLGQHEGILKLIRTFYVDARQHALLGPIFSSQIQDWPAHLEKIADFWALQCGGPTRYRGGFAGAHMSLGLRPEHFQHWLGLWELNNGRHLAPREAMELNSRAQKLGRRLFSMTQSRRPFATPPTPFDHTGQEPG